MDTTIDRQKMMTIYVTGLQTGYGSVTNNVDAVDDDGKPLQTVCLEGCSQKFENILILFRAIVDKPNYLHRQYVLIRMPCG